MRYPKLWLYSFLLSVLLCGAGLGELMTRRQEVANMYLLNKSLACTAILMITLSYVISAIHTFWNVSNAILLYRRYTGLIGYGFAILHIIASFATPDPASPSNAKFPFPAYFVEHPIAISAAVIGFFFFSYAFVLSIFPHRHNGTPQKARAWRRKLRYGYIGVLFICIHVALLKIEGWITWFNSFTPVLPPLSLIVACLLFSMIVLKILQLKKERRIFELPRLKKMAEQE